MQGGLRENAGRKKGFSAIEAEKAREFIVQRVNASLEPIIAALIDLAKQGNIKATQLLFDRAYGRPITPIETTIEQVPAISLILDEFEKGGDEYSEKYDKLYQERVNDSVLNNNKIIEQYTKSPSVLTA